MDARTAPVSSAQARLWLLDRMFPGESLYNELVVLRVEGTIDAAQVARALNDVVRRHAALRTRFDVHAGEPVQRIATALELALPLDDVTAIAGAQRDDVARARALGDARIASPPSASRCCVANAAYCNASGAYGGGAPEASAA